MDIALHLHLVRQLVKQIPLGFLSTSDTVLEKERRPWITLYAGSIRFLFAPARLLVTRVLWISMLTTQERSQQTPGAIPCRDPLAS